MYHLAVPNQTVPDWVQHLPEPERSEKIAFIRQYGSPNVFSQFQPHVTLACDENAAALSAAFEQKRPQVKGGWVPKAVVLGPTGPCGTVGHFFDGVCSQSDTAYLTTHFLLGT
jgi:hypothetical protein